MKQYPQSRFADLAKDRIEEVKDKPPDPKNEIEWIASKFRRSPHALPTACHHRCPPAGLNAVAPQDQPAFGRSAAARHGPEATDRRPPTAGSEMNAHVPH